MDNKKSFKDYNYDDIIDLEEDSITGNYKMVEEEKKGKTEEVVNQTITQFGLIVNKNINTTELVVREKVDIPEEYLLAFIVKDLIISGYDFTDFWIKISNLSLDQLKKFGGNILDVNDMNRAMLRAFKLINLGLEVAASKEDKQEDKLKLAKAIFKQKPLELIYQAGKIHFIKDKEVITNIIKKSEIEVEGFWFRLISKQEIDKLKKFTSVDTIKGTFFEYKNEREDVQKILNKFKLTPFLSLKYCLRDTKYWGSLKKGYYPTDFGAIDNILLSLIIACMFRKEENFFTSKGLIEQMNSLNFYLEEHKRKIGVLNKFIKEGVQNDYLEELRQSLSLGKDDIQHILRLNEQENKERNMKLDGKKLDHIFLVDILKVSINEIEKFSDIILQEKELITKIFSIKNFLVEYFLVAGENLNLKIPYRKSKDSNEQKKLQKLIQMITEIYLYSIQDIINEIKIFYSTIKNEKTSNIKKIMEFWDQRVLIEKSFKEEKLFYKTRKEIIAKNILEKGFNIKKINGMPLDQIIDITKNFHSWNEEDKKYFCKNFNPNIFFLKEKNCVDLIKLLKNFSHPLSTGWDKIIIDLDNTINEDQNLEKEKSLVINTKDWIEEILNKINIVSLDPYIISEIWKLGSDQIRNIIFSKRGDIKISIPSLKRYYIFEHEDTRLLDYVLQKLINEDKLKPSNKQMWDNLLLISDYMPSAKKTIKEKYDQINKIK